MPDASLRENYIPGALRVVTLGRFGVYHGQHNIASDNRKHQKIWLLFQYLLTMRGRRVPAAELFDVLDLRSNAVYPDKALQNLIYRLRSVLTVEGIPGASMILHARGSYYLDDDAPLNVDADELRALIAHAKRSEPDDIPGCADEMRSLYAGAYLEEAAQYAWAEDAATKLRDDYALALGFMAGTLLEAARPRDTVAMLDGAEWAVQRDAALMVFRIEALLMLGETQRALRDFEQIKDVITPEITVHTPLLRGMCSRAMPGDMTDEIDMGSFMAMLDAPRNTGAFVCDSDVFSKLFQLEERRIARTGQIVFLVLITLRAQQGARIDHEQLARAADLFSDMLAVILRRSDVITRLNLAQFALLLPTITFEDGEMVIRRLVSRFEMRNQVQGIEVINKLEPIQRLQ